VTATARFPEWQPHPAFPLILGSDVSGVVAALDDGVEGFSVGDEVYAMVRFPQNVMEGVTSSFVR
jgi:NADPH2:quinone reductase